jgi:hypothetical protein
VPSDDWCMVGSRMPRAMTQGIAFSIFGRALRANRASFGQEEACSQRSRNAGRELDPQHEHVGHDAEGHLEEAELKFQRQKKSGTFQISHQGGRRR